MSCSNQNNSGCNSNCRFNIRNFGVDDVTSVVLNGSDRTQLNWKQISIPEILTIPPQKPDIEQIGQIHVEVDLNQAKLIETPFAFGVFSRLATPLEISLVQNILDLIADLTIQPIIDAVNAILAIPGLPVIPEVALLQAALDAVVAAFNDVLALLAEATAIITGPCVLASAVVAILQLLLTALNLLLAALNALIDAANALAAAINIIDPIVLGPLVTAAVAVLVAAINVVIDAVNIIITLITDLITQFGITQFLRIIENEEGTCLTGRKIIVEGVLKQRVVYTALEPSQSVHSACFEIPFSAFIVAFASFVGLEFDPNAIVVVNPETCETAIGGFPIDPLNPPVLPPVVNLCEDFSVSAFVEDIFATTLDERTIFKNITLFLLAKPLAPCV